MNQMMMGNMNMNQMGINNQLMTNFAMDETAMKIKAIIAPYEQQIAELEKKIKQKDFEILVLNEKLNKYKNQQMNFINQNINMNNQLNMFNIQNQNMMNNQIPMMNQIAMNNQLNWMNQYNMGNNNNMENNNMNNNINNQNKNENNEEDSSKKINIIFVYKEKTYNELCTYQEKVKKVFKRFCNKLNIDFCYYKFIFPCKPINLRLRVAEAGIQNKSRIILKETDSCQYFEYDDDENENNIKKVNIIFRTTNGHIYRIAVNEEYSIGFLIIKYLKYIGNLELLLENKMNSIFFIFNAKQFKISDKTKVKEFFKGFKNPTVTVTEMNNLIGG